MGDQMKRQQLDARRLLCPLPVIKTQNAIKDLHVGDQLEVICTDPGALQDIPCWCRMYGHQVLQQIQSEREIRITIEVNGEAE